MAVRPYRTTTDIFRPFMNEFAGLNGGRMAGTDLLRTPEADVFESTDQIHVAIELPGVPANQVDVNLEDNVLTISGEKSESSQEEGKDGRWHLSERRYGRFTRTFVLPREVDTDHISASFDDGVLRVSIPKSERAKPRKIKVQTSVASGELTETGA